MVSLKQAFIEIKNDISEISFKKFIRRYLFDAAFRVLLNHRLGKYFYFRSTKVTTLLAKRYKYILISRRGCDISYKAVIGKNLKLPHPHGIVIGDGVIIQDNVKIWHQVTLGSHGKSGEPLAYPIVEDGVKIYPGAKIIGGITIGKNAIIGANTVVNIDIPKGATAVGTPCRIVQK